MIASLQLQAGQPCLDHVSVRGSGGPACTLQHHAPMRIAIVLAASVVAPIVFMHGCEQDRPPPTENIEQALGCAADPCDGLPICGGGDPTTPPPPWDPTPPDPIGTSPRPPDCNCSADL